MTDHAQSAATQALAATVDRLRDEVDGLKAAMRSRAVIEQAKGMLMERHGDSPHEAFLRMARLSQHANIKLVDVAAALVNASAELIAGQAEGELNHDLPEIGGPGPDQLSPRRRPAPAPRIPSPAQVEEARRARLTHRWPNQGSGAGEFGARVRAQGRGARIRAELLAARSAEDVLRTLMSTAFGDHGPEVVLLAVVDASGVLRLAGSHGLPATSTLPWRAVPVDLPIPVCEVVRTGVPHYPHLSGDSGEIALGYGLPRSGVTVAILPLTVSGAVLGVLVLGWSRMPGMIAAERRPVLERLAAAVATTVARLPRSEGGTDGGSDPELALLDVLPHPVLVCAPEIGGDRLVTDLRIRYANAAAVDPAGRAIGQELGRSLVELWPELMGGGLLDACRRALLAAGPVDLPPRRWSASSEGRQRWVVAGFRVVRPRDRVLVTWWFPPEASRSSCDPETPDPATWDPGTHPDEVVT